MRKTKIVCTIGPSSEDEEILRKIIENGMNAARLNFSHGDHEEHKKRIDLVKKLRKEMNKQIAIVLDTKGPEIRTGNFKEGKVQVIEGQKFTLTTRDIDGDNTICSITYKELPQDVKEGSIIRIDDGIIGLKVDRIEDTDIHCTVLNAGTISNHKGVNVPNIKIKLPAVTEKDIADIKFGIESGIDMIFASFIRKGADVLAIRKVLEKNGGSDILIISKIENQEGVDNIDEILKLSDGIMVARGDLGVEIPTEDVPIVQKRIIERCNKAGKPVITATQMLDSMMRNPRPTRAEASDVANAIFDGTDAIMLSGETAGGKYPVESIATMARIAEKTEMALNYEVIHRKRSIMHTPTVPDAISLATVTAAMELNAAAIITATQTGQTTIMVSKYKPQCPIIATTPYEEVARRLAIVRGVYPIISEKMNSADEVFEMSVNESTNQGYVKKGDLVVIAAGVPVGYTGTTNLMKVHIVGDVLVKGNGMGTSTYGNACVISDNKQIEEMLNEGDILVVKNLENEYLNVVMDRVSGVIIEQGGLTSHFAVECISAGIPVIVGAEGATDIIKPGTLVTLDTRNGMVYSGKANVL